MINFYAKFENTIMQNNMTPKLEAKLKSIKQPEILKFTLVPSTTYVLFKSVLIQYGCYNGMWQRLCEAGN